MKNFLIIFLLLFTHVAAGEANIPKAEMFSRARDVLQESLEKGDTATARVMLKYLQENVKNGAPLLHFEEYLIYMELGDFEQAIQIYANKSRFNNYYSSNTKSVKRIKEEDGLYFHLHKKFAHFNKTKADSLVNVVNLSNISQRDKDIYAVFLYHELAGKHDYNLEYHDKFPHNDTSATDEFLIRASRYVEQNPEEEESIYLKEKLIPPIKEIQEFRKDPFKHKYYSTGLGIYISKWWGFISGDAARDIEMNMGTYMLEVEAQLQNEYLNFHIGGFIAHGIDAKRKYTNEIKSQDQDDDLLEGYSLGFTLGFDIYDSRYFRVIPFIGIGKTPFLNMKSKGHFLFGTNFDIRLFASTPTSLHSSEYAIHLHIKYMAKICEYTEERTVKISQPQDGGEIFMKRTAGGKFLNQAISIGFGIYMW